MSDFSPSDFQPLERPEQTVRRYAGFWIRLVASLIDRILLSAVLYGLLMPALGLSFSDFFHMPTPEDIKALQAGHPLPRPPASFGKTVFYGLSLFIYLGYHVTLLTSSWQATLGKKAVGIYVETEGHARLSWVNALGRELAKFVSALILCIGYLMIAFTKEKTGLHDLMAGTRVVYGKKP